MSENNEIRENNQEETRIARRRTHERRREEQPGIGGRVSAWWNRKSLGEKVFDGVLLAGGLWGLYRGANDLMRRDDDDDDDDDDCSYEC